MVHEFKRTSFIHEIASRPLFKVVVGMLAVLGTASTVRELFLPEQLQGKLNFYRLWSLSWPWYVWVIVVLAAVLVVVFEGAVAAVARRETLIRDSATARRPVIQTAQEAYYQMKIQAEAPEFAHKIVTGYAGPSVKSDTKPYLAIAYVAESYNYVSASDPDEREYTGLHEYFEFTNANSGEVIRKVQVAPFTIWGRKVSVEPVSTLIFGTPEKKLVRGVDDQFAKAVRALHKTPVGVKLTVTYYGQHDEPLPYTAQHVLVCGKDGIRVDPVIEGAPVDWLDASEVVAVKDDEE
jgi:hypothetical protein